MSSSNGEKTHKVVSLGGIESHRYFIDRELNISEGLHIDPVDVRPIPELLIRPTTEIITECLPPREPVPVMGGGMGSLPPSYVRSAVFANKSGNM